MAGKHYVIATQNGYLDGEFHSKEAAVKALAEEVRSAAQACRRSHKSCSVVGSARKGSVQIKVGGRQGYHLWQRYVINERPGARKPPHEARETAPEIHHATKKTSAQLNAEIAEVLAGPLLNPATPSGVVTRNYEYVVYPEASHRHAERSVKVPQRRGRGPYDLGAAKLVAKQMGSPAAIYSVSKGGFVGYVHPNGRYVTFR